MHWCLTNRADPLAATLADRHYSRQSPGARQFVPPGRCVVLVTPSYDALWVSSWSYPEHVKHQWAGAWMCSLFRNESHFLASDLIRSAVDYTVSVWGVPPKQGMVTFVDATKIQSVHPGYCFKCAGWQQVGYTKGGLLALQWHPLNAAASHCVTPSSVIGEKQKSSCKPFRNTVFCPVCEGIIPQVSAGRLRTFCSAACKQKSYRARRDAL